MFLYYIREQFTVIQIVYATSVERDVPKTKLDLTSKATLECSKTLSFVCDVVDYIELYVVFGMVLIRKKKKKKSASAVGLVGSNNVKGTK